MPDFASFLGSIWFAMLLCAVGYGLGNVYPLRRFFDR